MGNNNNVLCICILIYDTDMCRPVADTFKYQVICAGNNLTFMLFSVLELILYY